MTVALHAVVGVSCRIVELGIAAVAALIFASQNEDPPTVPVEQVGIER
jgi:hypothetical protein